MTSNLAVDITKLAIEINYKVVRTEAFLKLISDELKSTFDFGPVKLPEALKGKAYSLFGRSYNDACITHKRKYKQMNRVTAGLICGLEVEEQEEEDYEVIDNDLFNEVDGISASGVIEFKREKYESNQAIKKC